MASEKDYTDSCHTSSLVIDFIMKINNNPVIDYPIESMLWIYEYVCSTDEVCHMHIERLL